MNTSPRSLKPLISELMGDRPERVPVWFLRQAGRYLPEYRQLRARQTDFLRFCYTPDLTIEAALQPLRRFPLQAAIVFSDILVIPDALGQNVRFIEGEGPILEPIARQADIDRLQPERLERHLQPVADSIRGLAAAIPEDVALIGFAGGPWTLAVYMVEGRGGTLCERVRSLAYSNEHLFGSLMYVLSEAVYRSLVMQIRAGADAVQIFDSWSGVLAEEAFRTWVIEPTRSIVSRLKADYPNIPVIGFPRLAGVRYQKYFQETGIDAVSLDHTIPKDWAVENLQKIGAIQGNLENILVVVGGKCLENEIHMILKKFTNGRFIFNVGHGILPETDPNNVGFVVDLVRKWRRNGAPES